MESISERLKRTTTPDESTRPADGVCSCGGATKPRWIPGLGVWSAAEACRECGRKAVEAMRVEREQREAEHIESERHEAIIGRVGTHKARMTLEAFCADTPSQAAALEAVHGASSLWLWGKPGCGKTHLAAAACIAHEDSRLWLTADLMAELRAASRDGDDEGIVSYCRRVGLLVLDDLGVDRPTAYATEQLYRIIDTRYDAGLRTIVTSNAAPSKVAATIGARIHSRLLGMCRVIHVEGTDRRLL